MSSPAPISPWLAGDLERAEPLHGDTEADVAILGAGYTGLSSALALRRAGLDVAVLEARTAGFGASGRNAGHLTPTIGKDLPTLTRLYGRERVRGLVQLADTAIAHVEALIDKHGIECDYAPVGNACVAVHPRQHAAIDRAVRTARDCDVPGELLDAAEMERRGLPRAFTRGFLEPHGGHLDPGRYVRGLRRVALEAGARLYEETPVVGVDEGLPAVVRTEGGRVRARHVVVATNAWTPQLRLPGSNALRLQVQLFRTAPLSDAQLEAVGWPGREGLYTAHEALESYRLTADRRIVGGSKIVRYAYGGRALPDVDGGVATRLEQVFRTRFPELRDVAVTDRWGGPIYMGVDFLPSVGRAGAHRNLLYAVGYAGHGLAQASYAGEMLADLLLERDGPGAALWSRRTVPLPPEPLRWLVFHALNGFFGRLDRRVDARVAAGEGRR